MKYIKENPLKVAGEILLLAGDIGMFSRMDDYDEFFDYVAKNFKEVYLIAGNHEYYDYYFDFAKVSGKFNKKIRDNVFLVNNHVAVIDGVRFIFSTMWTKIGITNQWVIQRSMNDFNCIQFGDGTLTVEALNHVHAKNIKFLTRELNKKHKGKTVVITHHAPTFMNYPPEHKGSALNEAFAVELFDLIEDTKPDYWVYGHHHSNIEDFKIGETLLITNQLGYIQHGGSAGFDGGKFISID